MAQIKETVELLTKILRHNGMSKVKSEVFRQSKFDKNEAVSRVVVSRSNRIPWSNRRRRRMHSNLLCIKYNGTQLLLSSPCLWKLITRNMKWIF